MVENKDELKFGTSFIIHENLGYLNVPRSIFTIGYDHTEKYLYEAKLVFISE